MEDIFKNEEINTMIYTIGAGVGANFELSDVNYDKIIIMTDADTDGAAYSSVAFNILLPLHERISRSRKGLYCFTTTL